MCSQLFPFQHLRQPGERCSRARLDGSERNTEVLRDLTLRQPAPVRELQCHPLPLGQLRDRAVHAPAQPGLLRAIAGATIPLVDPSFIPDAAASQLTDGTSSSENSSPFTKSFPYLGTPVSGYDSIPPDAA